MLRALELQDFAIVDALRLELTSGFNVLSGETGAGKSILIDALALLIGGRADSSLIRTGATSALIQGFFDGETDEDTPSTAGSSPHITPTVVSRRLQRSGRSSARLDGEVVKIGDLAAVGTKLVAIHGQHASQTLLEASEQRKLLDRLLRDDDQQTLRRYRDGYARLQQVRRDLTRLRETLRERARRLDMLKFQIDEIDAAQLRPGEEDTLREQADSLRHAERIVAAAGRAQQALSEDDANVLERLADAQRDLEQAGRYHPGLRALADELSDALLSVQATANEVEGFLADFEVEPARLEQLETRLAKLETLKNKYGDSTEAVLRYRDDSAAEYEQLGHAEADIDTLTHEETVLHDTLNELAEQLSGARREVARHLSDAVTREIRPLGMANARFSAEVIATDTLGADGRDAVRFLFSANLGEPLAPLADVASGGELSRVMLGLNVVSGSDLPTLVFDEVDAGIGGQTARAVGALLKRLAEDHQVLVVTHLPQVAAFADTQFLVDKHEQDGRTVTRIRELGAAEREAELARMLSGAVTDTARAHARELLDDVRAPS